MTDQNARAPLVDAHAVLGRQLENPPMRREWERLAPARAIAHALVRYRAEHDLTQAELGRRLGLPQSSVARLETATHHPSLATLVRVARALNLDIRQDKTR